MMKKLDNHYFSVMQTLFMNFMWEPSSLTYLRREKMTVVLDSYYSDLLAVWK